MNRRKGFTLVELLVVIAIIGVLVALLLPAIQAAREAARRSECSNHLKQMGLAFQTFHDTFKKKLPHGGGTWWYAPRYVNGIPQTNENQFCGWGFQILPFMEQQALFDGSGQVDDNARMIQVMSAPVREFFCPSKRRPQVGGPTANWYAQSPGGNNSLAPYGPTGNFGHAFCDYAGGNLENEGAIVWYPSDKSKQIIGLKDITDGTANTILIGEKRLNILALGVYQGDDNEGYTSGWDHDTMRKTRYRPLKDHVSASGDGNQRFGGSHPGVFQVVLCDGSVRALSYNIDASDVDNSTNLTVFNRLGRRGDGNPVDVP